MLKQVDKYRLIEQIGSGTAGVVYRAEDPDIARTVAIKIMKADFFGAALKDQAVERFSSEIRTIGRLAHPNIVSIFDSGITADGRPYLVMQYVEGRNLELILRDIGGAMEVGRVLRILRQLAAAIDYAHTQNVVHRDIKPGNILLGSDDHVFIVDFSTAVVANDTLLPAGQVAGTPQFMSPEIIKGGKVTPSADLYSLGIIAFLLFTGKRPFREGDVAVTFDAVLRQSAFSFSELGCGLGAKLERVLRRALAKNPADRFATATEFVLECEKSLSRQALKSFSQVASNSDVEPGPASVTSIFNVRELETRRRFQSFPWLSVLLIFFLVTLFLAAFAIAAIIFGTEEDSSINQKLRTVFGVEISEQELKRVSSTRLLKILIADMPKKIKEKALKEAINRNSSELAMTLSTLINDEDPEIRRLVFKGIATMSSMPESPRDYLIERSLDDSDALLRIYAATEISIRNRKKAKLLIATRQKKETDPFVFNVLKLIIPK